MLQMPIKSSIPTQIACDGSLRVTLTLTAARIFPQSHRYCAGVGPVRQHGRACRWPIWKLGAKTFIDIIDEATDGNAGWPDRLRKPDRGGQLCQCGHGGHWADHLGGGDLKTAVDDLGAGEITNHADAFAKAIQLFDPASANAKVMVMFTDGNTTAGGPPAPVAAAARPGHCDLLHRPDWRRQAGRGRLNDWATDPDNSHVAVTPDAADLEGVVCPAGRQHLQARGH